jgi:tetratricopeptide (TPR) repeat protein
MMFEKQKMPFLKVALITIMLLSGLWCSAQVLTPDLPQNRSLILMEEQYQQGHYSLAAQSAKQFLNAPDETIPSRRAADIDKAEYYYAVAGLRADLPGCSEVATEALDHVTNTAYHQRIAFTLAQYYFKHNDMAHAIPLYESSGITNLNNTEIADAKFELAYCYFNNRQFDKAEPLLMSIKEIRDGKYYIAGNYYYGLLAYNDNKYKEALKSFEKIKDAKDYRNVVPYYIAEIYYFMGNKAKALQLADTIIKGSEKSFYDNELHLLAAQCLFEDQKYAEARPYFEYYYTHADKIRKEDLYEMGYCDYRTSEWAAAIDKFKMLSNAQDSLGQTSVYLLGDCYVKVGDMQSARNAFGICADMTFNTSQQEASMIVYSKISYETGYTDEALRQLKNLLKTFPNTKYKDEANTLMSGLLIRTNNYEEALNHLENVGRREQDYKQVYQKATFGYAVQSFRDGDLDKALKYFTLSTKYPVSADYEGAAYFWKGEISYQLHRYNDVISFSQDFLSKKNDKAAIANISPQATEQHAYLNMGFAAMETHNYIAAQNYFAHAREVAGNDRYSALMASLREADAVFMQKNYSRAIILYDRIITTDTVNKDYALYQKSILLGLLGKNSEKIEVLKGLMNAKPPSAYANHARYEIAVTYLDEDKYTQALPYLHQLTDSINDQSYAPKAWMKTGFTYQQLNEYKKAIDAYKHVIIDYPASEDRPAALDAIRNLYIQINQPGAFAQMLKDNKLPSADSASVDSTYYAAAETQFANGKWEDAKTGFDNYLRQYPNGIFAIKAHYYRAESNFQLKKYKEAMQDYSFALTGRENDFYENSARRAAAISYAEMDYPTAYGYYKKLRTGTFSNETKQVAYSGLMRTSFHSDKFSETSLYADSLLALPGLSEELTNEALYYKARSLQHTDSLDAALKVFRQLSTNKNGDIAAESRYHVAEILYKQNDLKAAEPAANDAIHLSAGYDYWIVKSYILLSDILVKEKDYFNAKATLESVVKHTKLTDLKQEAIKKLDEVKKLEKHQSKLSEE